MVSKLGVNSVPRMVDHIATIIGERIASGNYSSSLWLPTERALAEEFGVSRPTIRQVIAELENRGLVIRASGSRPIINRQETAPPERSATARTSVGLWISGDATDAGGAMTLRGIHDVLDPDLYRLVVASHTGYTLDELIRSERETLTRFANDKDIAGLILWYFGGDENLETLQMLRNAGIPMVFIDREPPAEFPADYVGVCNDLSAQQAVTHLLELGHRRIAHITNTETASTVGARFEGYRRALNNYGIPIDPCLVAQVRFMEYAKVRESARRVVNELLALPDPPTAIFAVNDHTAKFMIRELQQRGLRVPEDFSVVGFDDAERIQIGLPFLTTIRQPFRTMGEEAARMLLTRMTDSSQVNRNIYTHVKLDALLVVRKSTQTLHSEPFLNDMDVSDTIQES